jgi:hypothetical protein
VGDSTACITVSDLVLGWVLSLLHVEVSEGEGADSVVGDFIFPRPAVPLPVSDAAGTLISDPLWA